MSIFIQMVSYKNFDVVQTVRDCIERAKDKEGLHFGLCLQQDEDVPAELNHPHIKIERVPFKQSPGHGWARAKAQSMYDGQDYTLQLESGCRLADGWDDQLIGALKTVGSERAVITNPANKFNPANSEREFPEVAYKAQCYQFLFSTPSYWPVALKNVNAIQRARNISDHFFFTRGEHCKEVAYDPNLYYSEVESALTLRSFTLGYELFHHFKPVVFRNYTHRPMNWSDDSDWWAKDKESKSRFNLLLLGSPEFGLGSVRSLKDFELYSGVDFIGRRLQRDANTGVEPPCKFEDDAKWQASYMRDFSITASWDPIKVESSDDYDYWAFTIEDDSNAVISRQDLRWERDKDILEKKISYKKVFFKAQSDRMPSKVGIQPFSKSKGALNKVIFDI